MQYGHPITQDQQATEKPALKTQNDLSAGQLKNIVLKNIVYEYNQHVQEDYWCLPRPT
jgi:hypothetical protein